MKKHERIHPIFIESQVWKGFNNTKKN